MPTIATAAPRTKKAPPIDHYQAMTAYATAFPAAMIAEKTCPGIKTNLTMLFMLRSVADISEDEESLIKDKIMETTKNLYAAIEKNGKLSWCSNIWSLFGEQGSTLPNLIRRP